MQLDIAFAVNRLATFTANPSMKHYAMLKRIIQYLAGTKQFGITYRKMYRKLPIMGYANASHANQDEQKSILGILFTAARGAILWKSKKQMLSAQPSTEVEYIALAQLGCKACWFCNLYMELGFPLQHPILCPCVLSGMHYHFVLIFCLYLVLPAFTAYQTLI